MVEMARYFLEFTQRESCGKCTFCRLGTKQMLEMLAEFTKAKGHMEDLDTLDRAGRGGQGGVALRPGPDGAQPGPDHLRYFRDEYEAHIEAGALPGADVPGPYRLLHPPGEVRALLRRLRRQLHRGGHQPDKKTDQGHRPGEVRQVRHLHSRLSARVQRHSQAVAAERGAQVKTVAVETVSLTIDGQEIEAPEGEKLLWAALDNDIYIPHLCADRRARDSGCLLPAVLGGDRGHDPGRSPRAPKRLPPGWWSTPGERRR